MKNVKTTIFGLAMTVAWMGEASATTYCIQSTGPGRACFCAASSNPSRIYQVGCYDLNVIGVYTGRVASTENEPKKLAGTAASDGEAQKLASKLATENKH